MDSSLSTFAPEAVHPSLWRASQLARATTRCVETGHPALTTRLPGGGWPTGVLTELLQQQPGIGEVRLLAPALASVAHRQVFLVAPPHPPQALALAALGLAPQDVVWIRSEKTADTLWATEQVLRSGTGAVLLWQHHVRPESLRRLHLASTQGDTLFFLFRPLAAAQDASPAPLRLSLRSAPGGLDIGFVKRRGPSTDETLFLPMPVLPAFRIVPQRSVPERRPAPMAVPGVVPELIR